MKLKGIGQKLFFLPLLLLCCNLAAQRSYSGSDSAVIFQWISRADEWSQKGNTDSALFCVRLAAQLSRTVQFARGEGWALSKETDLQINDKKYTSAESSMLRAHRIGNQLKDSLLVSVSMMQRAQIFMYTDEPDSAIMLFDKSLRYKLEKAANEYTALAYNDLGYTCGLKDEYEKQADFTTKALNIYEKQNNVAGMAMTLSNLSTMYYKMGQREKALEYGKRSLYYREKTGDIELISLTCCNLSQYYLGFDNAEAAKYQQLCVKYAQQTGIESRMIHAYITSSLVANSQKKNDEAFEYEKKVISLLEKSGSNPGMLARRYIAAAFYADLLKQDTAVTIGYYKKSLQLATEKNDKGTLRDAYSYMANYYRGKKNFENAYLSYQKYILYRDSLINADKERTVAEIETRYETEKKDNEIARLNADQRIRQLQIEKQNAIIAGNLAEARQKENEIELLSKSRELQQAQLSRQGEEIEKQQLLAANKEKQLQLAEQQKQLDAALIKKQKQLRNGIIAGSVLFLLLGVFAVNRYQLKRKLENQARLLEMRNNISRNLHDDIGASLSNINILAELARRNLPEQGKSHDYLLKASEDIQHISESLSDIVWNINPRYDDLQHLFVRMKRYASDMMDGKNISYELNFPDNAEGISLQMDKRRDFYLVFKEAVNNLAKYSKATTAVVALTNQAGRLHLLVKDNGIGFQPSEISNGNGLLNMKKRAADLGAQFSLTSAPGQGTRVELVLPIT